MLFAHLKRILKLERFRLRGPNGARDEFHLAAAAQNLRKLARLVPMPTPPLSSAPTQLLQRYAPQAGVRSDYHKWRILGRQRTGGFWGKQRCKLPPATDHLSSSRLLDVLPEFGPARPLTTALIFLPPPYIMAHNAAGGTRCRNSRGCNIAMLVHHERHPFVVFSRRARIGVYFPSPVRLVANV
jgi:hypothetical protein